MLTTTTNAIEGKTITQYYGVVSGETIIGANIIKDFFVKKSYDRQKRLRCRKCVRTQRR